MSTNLDLINEFNNRIPLLQQQYYDRGILKKEVRSYEVSLWTLQDEFLTVLKWSDVEQKGRIESPMLTINVDGTQKFTFSIPMQYVLQGVTYDNPSWYSVETGQLIMGLRKVKVIFNKGEEYEVANEEEQARLRSSNVFELIITKVTEDHADDQTRCNVECEGLAFHELGKIGYKLNLSQENFELDRAEWDESAEDSEKPKHWIRYDNTECYDEPNETVQYWCEEGCHLSPRPADRAEMSASQWYYDIQMNWGSFSDMVHRAPDKIYEEEYVSSWTNDLKPQTIETFREKARPVEASESNLYNITQTIAETFGIYCRYEYGYDDNYHIISRQIIFYNNYFDETNMISFTYPYMTKEVSREMDSAEVTTKMYVRPQDSDVVASGKITIADCPASRTKEDYLLNFDYMLTCGAINQEQYDYIPVFEKEVRRLNIQLEDLSLQIAAQEKEKLEAEAKATIAKNSMALDQESIDYNTELYKRLDASDGTNDGYFSRVPANPYSTYIRENEGRFYIPLSTEDKGVDVSTLYIFRYFQSSKQTFKNQISTYEIKNDKYGTPSEIELPQSFTKSFTLENKTWSLNSDTWALSNTTDTNSEQKTIDSSLVYLMYKYKPKLYYDEVNRVWTNKLNEDEDEYESANDAATAAQTALNGLYAQYNQKLADKNALIKHFERVMGPALREGYWQPDDYSDYGNKKVESYNLTATHSFSSMIDDAHNEENDTYAIVGWDTQLFDDENKNYYEEGVLREKVYYPCIRLNNSLMSIISGWLLNNKTISFVFNNNYYKDISATEEKLIQNVTIFTLGSQMQFGFIVKTDANASRTVIPVLILTGAEKMTDEQITFMKDKDAGKPRIGVVSTEIVEGAQANDPSTVELVFESNPVLVHGNFVNSLNTYSIVYPRIKISSTELNTESIILKYNNQLLKNYTDYTILSRTVTRTENNNDRAYLEYFITIKPHILFKYGDYTLAFNIAYTLSNASTCIYLDAQKVLSDSSKPRASYTVSVNALNGNYLKTLYRNLTQIIMINDTKLKFENVFGYISQLDLNLDAPWEDKIEVKNYKTKFEDLFSTIVASSENMRQNEAALNAATAGRIPLQEDAIIKMIINNSSLLQEHLDNGLEASLYVKALLADVFTEAGAILADSHSALNDVKSLTLRNAGILSGFIQNIAAEVTPRVINSINQPTNFKVGDIWNELDENGNVVGRYVATSSSEDSTEGFTRTYDGHLAAIKGASLNVDTVNGTIELLAENQIDMKSGGNLYIAANERVDIVGNKSVNIGGTQINIGSTMVGNDTIMGGINLVATAYNDVNGNIDSAQETKVLIHPDKIEMGGSDIIMRGANSIQMITSRGDLTSTSALSISPADGIWIGSGAGVKLYSGNVQLTEDPNDGTFTISGNTGASIELMPEYLLFGVSNVNDGNRTAVKMTDESIILASGNELHYDTWKTNQLYQKDEIVIQNSILYRCLINHTSDNFVEDLSNNKWTAYSSEVNGTIAGLVGVKLTKNSIGFATQSGNLINAILMNDKGLTLGSGNFDLNVTTSDLLVANGSVVRIAPDGIDIGSTGHLFISTNNFTIDSGAINNDPMFSLKYPIKDGNGNIIEWRDALLYSNDDGLYIHGNIINDSMIFVNGSYTLQSGDTYSSGIYLVGDSVTGTPFYIEKNNIKYYAWQLESSGKTYYCASDSGTEHRVTANEVLWYYKSEIKGVTPRYARLIEKVTATEGYTYDIEYITTDGINALLVDGQKIRYDGSSSPNATWFLSIPSNLRDEYVIIYENETSTLVSILGSDLGTNTKLVRNTYNTNFSVAADTGMTLIKTGQLGNFYISPQGFFGGTVNSSQLSNSKINNCDIESYNTGYYGRCFYDYHMNRDTGILTLKRVDGTEVTIDIGTAAKVVIEGGSTGDSSSSSSGSSSSGGGSSGSGEVSGCTSCDSTCTGGCSTTCTGNCNTTCYKACADSCKTGCGTSCNKQCSIECSTGCSGGCGAACSASCTNACKTTCKGTCKGSASGCAGCSEGCSNSCTGSCSGACDSECADDCSTTCASVCYGSCGSSCSTGCSTGCYLSCSGGCKTTCDSRCQNSCTLTCAVGAGAVIS